MSKVKYYYDSETLSYRKIENKRGRKFGLAVLVLVGIVLSGLLFFVLYLNIPYVETPKEKALKRELANTQLQFELLNKKMEQAETVLTEVQNRDNNLYRVYFEANPIPDEQRKAGFGGINRYKDLEGFDNSNLIIASNRRMDVLTKQIVVQSKSLDEIAKLAEEKEKLLKAIPAIQPVRTEDLTRVASGYGYRTDPFTKARKFHYGMDFTAPRGTPVYASGDGVVRRADAAAAGFGKHVRIEHGYGYESIYAHLYKYNVKKGQKVKRGDLIGFVGSTGRSQAPHLHYEIHKDGKKLNPIHFYLGTLSPQEFDAMVKAAQEENQSLD